MDFRYSRFSLSVGGKLSNLEIDVEDISESIFVLHRNGKTIPIRIHADFMQYPPSRFCKVVCNNGKIYADLIQNTIEWSIGNDIYTHSFTEFKRNDMFIAELQDFFQSVEQRIPPKITIEDGINSLRMAMAIKDSMSNNRIISI